MKFTRDGAVRRTSRFAAKAFAVVMAAAGLAATGTPRAEAEQAARVEPPVGRTAFAVPLSRITVDGKLDDWPEDMAVYKPRENTDVYGSTDLSGTDLDISTDFSPSFRVGYSVEAQKIYVAMEHRDDRVQVAWHNVRATERGRDQPGRASARAALLLQLGAARRRLLRSRQSRRVPRPPGR